MRDTTFIPYSDEKWQTNEGLLLPRLIDLRHFDENTSPNSITLEDCFFTTLVQVFSEPEDDRHAATVDLFFAPWWDLEDQHPAEFPITLKAEKGVDGPQALVQRYAITRQADGEWVVEHQNGDHHQEYRIRDNRDRDRPSRVATPHKIWEAEVKAYGTNNHGSSLPKTLRDNELLASELGKKLILAEPWFTSPDQDWQWTIIPKGSHLLPSSPDLSRRRRRRRPPKVISRSKSPETRR